MSLFEDSIMYIKDLKEIAHKLLKLISCWKQSQYTKIEPQMVEKWILKGYHLWSHSFPLVSWQASLAPVIAVSMLLPLPQVFSVTEATSSDLLHQFSPLHFLPASSIDAMSSYSSDPDHSWDGRFRAPQSGGSRSGPLLGKKFGTHWEKLI